jgi:hypothetical protein
MLATKASRRRPGKAGLPLDFRSAEADKTPARRPGGACSDGDRLTLSARIEGVWEGLLAAGAAECVVCHSRMDWLGDHGRCSACGTSLS